MRKWNWYGHWLLCIYSDVLRVAILYKFGGTYMDTDIITLSDHPSVRGIHKPRHFMFLTPSLSQWPYGLKNSSLHYWRALRGPRAWPMEKLPKWHFLTPACNFNFFEPNDFIWRAMKVPLFEFIQKMSQAPFSSVQVLIWEDKLDYLKNPSLDIKNYFCLGFLWIPSKAGRQN